MNVLEGCSKCSLRKSQLGEKSTSHLGLLGQAQLMEERQRKAWLPLRVHDVPGSLEDFCAAGDEVGTLDHLKKLKTEENSFCAPSMVCLFT